MNKSQDNKLIQWPGQQKSVVDDYLARPLNDLRISVMDRCNFRCPYCMPDEVYQSDKSMLKQDQRLSFEEIERLTRIFVGLGVRKVRLTGGEPLLRQNLVDLIGRLRGISELRDISMTTNGSLLAEHAEALKEAGLDRITVSLDSIEPSVFSEMTGGRGNLDQVLEGIRESQRVGLTPVKLNAVVQKGVNEEGVLPLLAHFRNSGIIARLIEYMDVGTSNGWSRKQVVPSAEMIRRINQRWPIRPVERCYASEVASRYEYVDGSGEIGFIAAVTEPFCGSCSRARISCDGKLYNCLFANEGLDLKTPMRDGMSDDNLRHLIKSAWQGRTERYSEIRGRQDDQSNRIEMYYIGG
jgi:cyclic pyranopterin phosphate synthase